MGWTPPPDDGIDVSERKCHRPLELEGASTTQITTVGLDLVKNVFQVHGVNRHGKGDYFAERAHAVAGEVLSISSGRQLGDIPSVN